MVEIWFHLRSSCYIMMGFAFLFSDSLLLSWSPSPCHTPLCLLGLWTYLCWPFSPLLFEGCSCFKPCLEMFFSLQLSSPTQDMPSAHISPIFCWVCVCVCCCHPPPTLIRRTWWETATLSSHTLNWLYPLGILKVQINSTKWLFTDAKVTWRDASPPPYFPTCIAFHCCLDLNFSVYQSKEMIFSL